MRRPNELRGLVYLFQGMRSGHFKNGCTDGHIGKRLNKVARYEAGEPVELVHAIRTDNPGALEDAFHKMYAPYWVPHRKPDGGESREWFNLPEDEVAVFKEIHTINLATGTLTTMREHRAKFAALCERVKKLAEDEERPGGEGPA
jgi:hypothetical protein